MEIRQETRGFHSGQIDLTLAAVEGNRVLAYLDYAEYQSTPHVQMIYVDPAERRNGLGAALLRHLQSLYPNVEIDLGGLTDDGGRLVSSLTFATVTDPHIDRLMRTHAQVKSKLAALDQMPPEEQMRHGDVWNRLHTLDHRLDGMLWNKKADKRIIEHGIPRMQGYVLYNSMDAEYATVALKNNEMLATSTQRFWPDGRRRKEDWEGYEPSYWMKGISFTRDVRYALKWKDVTFAVDSEKLRKRIKLIPFAWNYHFAADSFGGKNPDHKREREEFAIISAERDYLQRSEEDGGGFDTKRFLEPGGALKNLDQYLLGIMVKKRILDLYGEDDFAKRYPGILDHPKYRGAF